jgi:hypothetical protein
MIDYFLIISHFFSLLAAFLMLLPQSYRGVIFWLIVGCVTYLPLSYLPWHIVKFEPANNEADPSMDNSLQVNAERNAQRYNLSIMLNICYALFLGVYFLALFQGIGHAETIVSYEILSLLPKALFAAMLMDIHLELLFKAKQILLDVQKAKEAKELAEVHRTNEARRAFTRYIFHEVLIFMYADMLLYKL